MHTSSATRYLAAAALIGGIAMVTMVGISPAAEVSPKAADISSKPAEIPNVFQDGKAGFVVSHIAYALSHDASETGACPNGMSSGYGDSKGFSSIGDVFVNRPDLQRNEGEGEQPYIQRVFSKAFSDPSIHNLCLNPELGKPDPRFRTVTGKNVPADGIDLDGQDSRASGKPAPGTCAHDDFRGMNGERGIDNQWFRVVGCSKSYQSTGQSNTYEIEMYTGAWGILITLKGVTDLKNSSNVEVGLYANADPLQLSPTREALANATYAIDQDPRFRATTHGRIVNGVLTTDPVDVRFHLITNNIHLERPLRDARLRMTFTPDGGMEGIMAGYTPVEDMYDFQYGFRNGTDGKGAPAPLQLRTISSVGQAAVLEHTCNGAYYALKQFADGHRDPKTGQCTSISTQYRIKVIPAFVVDTPTQSVNSSLDGRGGATGGRY
jgi:hypothetical protein